jgi:hypothetical protein
MAKTLIELLGDDQRRTELARRARAHGEAMSWPSVGATYQDLFAEVVERHEARPLPRVGRRCRRPASTTCAP